MNKPTNPNIVIPESFADKGVKADFDSNKILNGFDRIQPDVLAGDNLNKFIDDTYKGLNYGIKGVDYLEERWKSQLTNCITEIPQNIKLELKDGVLTLKAGSKVYVPNGFEADGTTKKFDEVTIESDLISSQRNYDLTNAMFIENNVLTPRRTDFISSGGTAPSSPLENWTWYDTTNNIIKRYDGSTWTTNKNISLPIAITTSTTASLYTSIDQVFNGFGYIGSTVFVLPNVKCLIPNGRNEDGSLNNIEFVTDKVSTSNFGGTSTNILGIQLSNNDDISQQYHISYIARYAYYEQNTKPQVNIAKWFDTANNQIYYWNELETPYKIKQCTFGTFTITDDHITSFNPKLQFRAVDYSEFNSTPHIIDTYRNGNSWYRVWSDGWCEQGGAVNTSATGGQSYQVTLLKPYNNNLYNATTAFNIMATASVVRYNTYFILQTGLNNISYYTGDVYWSTAGYIT